ncbi:hypothetical protein AMTRI_Chr03g148030 [Amborella trichopoda]
MRWEACKRALVQKLPKPFPTKESFMQKLPATFPFFEFKLYHHLFNSNPQSNPFLNPHPQKTQILLLLIRIEAAISQKTQILLVLRTEPISQKTTNYYSEGRGRCVGE